MDTIAAIPPALPAVINQDLTCRKCGYNLRGLNSRGLCPECGSPVMHSLAGNRLQFCNPQWVTKLAMGTALMLAGSGVAILGILMTIFITVWMQSARSRRTESAAALSTLAGSILFLIGTWLLTQPNPSPLAGAHADRSRRVVRISLGFIVAYNLLSFVTSFFAMEHLLPAFAWTCVIAAFVGLIAQLNYVGKLAEQIPDSTIISRARFL